MRLERLRIGVETPIYFILFGMMAIQIAMPLHLNSIVSLGTWLIIIATLVSFAVSILARKISDKYSLFIIILALSVIMSIVATFSFSYPYVVAAFSFLEIPFLLVSYPSCKKQSIQRAIYACFVILSIYYTVISFSPLAYVYYTKYGAKIVDFMTLGYNNPNETAMYLLVCLFVLATLLGKLKNKIAKILVVIDLLLLSRLIVLTLSRTAITLLLVFVVLVFVFRKRQVPAIVRIISFAIPFLFLIVTFFQSALGIELQFMGEELDTGRLEIYNDVFLKMDFLRFFFGEFSTKFQNLHNAFWSIFATIGVVGLASFLEVLYSKIRDVHVFNMRSNKFDSKIALIGLFCIVAYMATESAFVTAGGTYAASFLCLYLIGVSEETPA